MARLFKALSKRYKEKLTIFTTINLINYVKRISLHLSISTTWKKCVKSRFYLEKRLNLKLSLGRDTHALIRITTGTAHGFTESA